VIGTACGCHGYEYKQLKRFKVKKMNFLMKDWLIHQSSQEEASSSLAESIMTSLERQSAAIRDNI